MDSVAKRNAEYAQAAVNMAQAAVTQGLLDNDYCQTFVDYYKKQGDAALVTAYSNWRNSATNERNAATNERNAATNEQNAQTRKVEVATKIVFGAISALSKIAISVVPGAPAAFGGLRTLSAGSPLPLPPM